MRVPPFPWKTGAHPLVMEPVTILIPIKIKNFVESALLPVLICVCVCVCVCACVCVCVYANKECVAVAYGASLHLWTSVNST